MNKHSYSKRKVLIESTIFPGSKNLVLSFPTEGGGRRTGFVTGRLGDLVTGREPFGLDRGPILRLHYVRSGQGTEDRDGIYIQQILELIENFPLGQFLWMPIMQYAVIGFLVGLFQWVFIRKHIRYNLAWPFVTSAFWSIGGLIGGGISNLVIADLHELLTSGHLITANQRNLESVE